MSKPFLKGIIHVTGEHDTGKTTFALECGADAAKIAFFDDDVKGRATIEEFKENHDDFGAYHDLTELGKGKTLLQFHEACLKIIDQIKPGQFDALIWDTWTRFASTCRIYVGAYPDKFRKRGGLSKGGEWSDMGTFKGAQMWQEAQRYEAQLLNEIQKKVPTVILVTHLKTHYEGKVKTDKEEPAASRTLRRVPRFRIWLRHNPNSPTPIGLVLKRLDRKYPTDRGLRTKSVLPRRIEPKPEDESLWDTIMCYWDDPIGHRDLRSDEVPDDFELSILDGTLTEEQRHTLNLMLESGAVEVFQDDTADTNEGFEVSSEKQDEPEVSDDDAAKIATMHSEGVSPFRIYKETGIPLATIRQIVKDGGA